MVNQSVDVLIVGGGLVGASLMLALKQSGYKTLLVEAKPITTNLESELDARNIALSTASVNILQQLNVWSLLHQHACPIDDIHVSERYGFGATRLHKPNRTPLGYVINIQHLNNTLQHSLDPSTLMTPAKLIALDPENGTATLHQPSGQLNIKAHIIVAADGAESALRQWCGLSATTTDYHQHAIVSNIGLARSHHNIAYERFTHSGPLAFLPINGLRASLIWCLSPDDAAEITHLSDPMFLQRLQLAFGYRLGRLSSVGRRTTFPLRQVLMPQQSKARVVFVGNAAHTLHPVAAQGFNLGLRDIAVLAQCMLNEGLTLDMLKSYHLQRANDQWQTTHFTDGLIRLFGCHFPGMALARRAGLMLLDHVPPLKHSLSRFARGFIGMAPDLVSGIPLRGTNEH